MVTSSQTNLAWIAERMDCIKNDLRFLYRDLEVLERREHDEWH
jgi:hypothetical protein